jgi:predicted phage terminase large subunit-like protein
MTREELEKIKTMRWLARTDLKWFCNNVLDFTDVNSQVHQGLLDKLQHFPKPKDQHEFDEHDKLVGKSWVYTPLVPLKDLRCSKRTLILDSRGFLKTSINVIAHTLQWIINYPDITILIVQSNTEKAELFLKGVKAHFVNNPKFRQLFPEHCPNKKLLDWGTMKAITTEARSKTFTGRESTVMTASIDKGVAGLHVDVIKFSDIVEENNARDATQCDAVSHNFNSMKNLLVSPLYWIDVEGTRYNYADCYGEIIKQQMKLDPKDRTWDFYINTCFEKAINGPRTYGPEEMKAPYAKDAEGRYIPRWPERFPLKDLLDQQLSNPYIFACQQLNDPKSGVDSRDVFPLNDKYPKWVSDSEMKNVNIAYRQIVVDTAETAAKRSDYSAITVGAWDNDGRLYVEQIYTGKYLPDELIKLLVNAIKLHRPRYVDIEETGFVRGIKASLGREMHKNGLFIPVRMIKRDNTVAKKERILNSLQPWYMAGLIRFKDDILAKTELIDQLSEFPGGRNDDILDTLADFFQNKDYFGRENPRDIEPDDRATIYNRLAEQDRQILTGEIEDPRLPAPSYDGIRTGLVGIL